MTAYNIDNLGIKAILKTTGKETAKVMVKNGQPAETQGAETQKQGPDAETENKNVQKQEEEEMKK